ncbi:MAG: hypothetical protein GWM92_16450 [Gemmatimonadetes bacterium]|nr:hypothetical protein [Gemmatimonadota bacterium]NIR80347.1 hypothetical protein [Gemmatimonadota bacterium]NIT89110.1 hypothetical protein [Gemmatimonadota bacterium]NIU32907.1 hypothetical protein [Gemmatimonadota bacterium]NIU37306.1 hypothetical protein [Gemmatimonadota bacterium]
MTTLDEKFERHRTEIADQFREQRELIIFSHRDLDRRVTNLEERVDRLEGDPDTP